MNNNYFEDVSALLSNWRKIDDDVNLKITWNGKYENQVYSEIRIFNYTEEKKASVRKYHKLYK